MGLTLAMLLLLQHIGLFCQSVKVTAKLHVQCIHVLYVSLNSKSKLCYNVTIAYKNKQ